NPAGRPGPPGGRVVGLGFVFKPLVFFILSNPPPGGGAAAPPPPLTLLYAAKNTEQNHARVLAAWLAALPVTI
ncbi:hypothetical protein ACYCKI_25610, partial [Klebsiella pneumoniae]